MKFLQIIPYKWFAISSLLLLFLSGCKSEDMAKETIQQVPILLSKSDTVWIEVNSIGHRSPLIISESDSVFDINLGEKGRQFILQLKGDTKSIQFQYRGNSTEYALVTNNRDSVSIKIYFGGVRANFSSSYVHNHKGRVKIEIPPVYELANIAFALAEKGKRNSTMISNNSSYFSRLTDYFSPFSKHPLIIQLQEKANENYGYYFNVRTNSYAYDIENRTVVKGNIYSNIRGGSDYFNQNIELFRDFAQESDFYDFYENERAYYDSLTSTYRDKLAIGEMWEWLEKEFPESVDGYKIVLSPLTGSSHTTVDVQENGYKEILMFVNMPDLSTASNETLGNIMRGLFTEIDHNYVNPVSDSYQEEINTAMGDYQNWTQTGSTTYHSTFAAFNEYMTWAVFTLYAYDYFDQGDFEKINTLTVNSMVQGRKFHRFREFNSKLLDLYRTRENGLTVAQLYPDILDWMSNDNH